MKTQGNLAIAAQGESGYKESSGNKERPMQTYDDVQFASIQRSHAYLRKKEHNAWVDRENRQDLVLTLLLVTMVALSVVGLVAAAVGA